jgi:hypothetical protein
LGKSQVPLDVFLNRGHALPLAYLNSPSTSFLTHLSPQAYLSLLRASTSPEAQEIPIDIPLSTLRTFLTAHPSPEGVTLATLSLAHFPSSSSHAFSHSHPPSSRPTFPTSIPIPEHPFLPIPDNTPNTNTNTLTWTLAFEPGVVLSQGRMREIEGLGVEMQVGRWAESWVDLLVCSIFYFYFYCEWKRRLILGMGS